MKQTLTEWVTKELERLNKRRAVVDKYRIEVLEGIDDTDEKWFEESQRLTGAIDVLTKLEQTIKKGGIGAV